MIAQERQNQVLQQLRRHPRVAITQLQQQLAVSRSTLRRDLVDLENRGQIVRVHGGVVLRGFQHGEPTFERRRMVAAKAKHQIANQCVQLVPENATVFIDAGTTCLLVGRQLLTRDDLHLFTNSVTLLAEGAGAAARVACIGGELRDLSQALVGAVALNWLDALRFDLAFLGASGLDEHHGLSTTDLNEAHVKHHVIQSASQTYLAADTSKWDHPAAVRFAYWHQITGWVVEKSPPPAARERVRAAGVRIIIPAKAEPTKAEPAEPRA